MSSRAGKARSGRTDGVVSTPLLDRLLFFVLLAVLCARPLISESFERAELSFLPVDSGIGTTPATTIWLDGILLVATALVWIRRWQPRPRAAVVTIGLGLLLASVVVSVAVASDKRLAANAGAHLFVMALAATALVRVMRSRWMVHVLIAALLAGGVANAVKCITQRAYEFGELRQYWEEQKPALAERGVSLDSPALINYERRLRSAEAYGYLYHPNVTASCLTMVLLVAVGLVIAVLRKPGLNVNEWVATAIIAGALLGVLCAGLYLTGSVGGAGAAAAGGLVLLALGLVRRWAAAHTRGLFTMLVLAYVGIIAAGAGYGLLKGTLPHTSLAFRWQYWQAAARTVGDAPLTGVGRENFRAAYLRHKSAESTEEVSNAHDIWLALLVELGPLGLAAGVLLIGAAVHGALRNLGRVRQAPPTAAGYGALVSAAVAVLLVQGVFSGEQFGVPGILLLWVILVAGVWIAGYAVGYSLSRQAGTHPPGAGWLVAGLTAALCAALIHNLIGFSLFTPAGLATFVVIVAAAYRLGPTAAGGVAIEGGRPGGTSGGGSAVAIGFAVLFGAYGRFVAIPTVRMEAAWQQITRDVQTAPDHVYALAALKKGRSALERDPWSADTALAFAEMALSMEARVAVPVKVRRDWLALARNYAEAAASRAPQSFGAQALLARVAQRDAELTGDPERLVEAAAQWDRAVALYPTNPRTRIAAGQAFYRAWEATGWPDYAYKARDHLCAALAIDATRKPEVAAKLRASELQVVYALLIKLESAGFGACEAPAPKSQPSR